MNALAQITPVGARLPATYEAATNALADCASIDECQTWADKAAGGLVPQAPRRLVSRSRNSDCNRVFPDFSQTTPWASAVRVTDTATHLGVQLHENIIHEYGKAGAHV